MADFSWKTRKSTERPKGLKENRCFQLAVRELITQSINHSVSLSDLSAPVEETVTARAGVGKMAKSNLLSSMGIDEGTLNKPLRRPKTQPPQPSAPENPRSSLFKNLAPLDEFFTDELIDEMKIYHTMEKILVRSSWSPSDLLQIMGYLSSKALGSSKNVATICKYMYVFSTDPIVGENLGAAFDVNLESNFKSREELKQKEGPTRYKNFVRWVMAAVHHFRNLQLPPTNESLLKLLSLADEASSVDNLDIPLYCVLILRLSYYSTLIQSPDKGKEAKKHCEMAIERARTVCRDTMLGGGLSPVQVGWLTLVLEVTWAKKHFDEGVAAHFEKALPHFSLVHPRSLKILLPKGHIREKYLMHIKNYITLK